MRRAVTNIADKEDVCVLDAKTTPAANSLFACVTVHPCPGPQLLADTDRAD